MAKQPDPIDVDDLVTAWSIPSAARLGSSVRSKGIFLEMRARLPVSSRKALSIKSGELTLRMTSDRGAEFSKASKEISRALIGIEDLPVIPREIEDVLTISSTERHRWLKDGRLPSIGTRTVKLRGRAKQITFHVFDPRVVEDLLNRDAVADFRETDALTKAENRRRAAWKRNLGKPQTAARPAADTEDAGPEQLIGWAEFEKTGLLR